MFSCSLFACRWLKREGCIGFAAKLGETQTKSRSRDIWMQRILSLDEKHVHGLGKLDVYCREGNVLRLSQLDSTTGKMVINFICAVTQHISIIT